MGRMHKWAAAAARLSSLLRGFAAAGSIAVCAGKLLHAQALVLGVLPHVTLETDIILMYSRSLDLYSARTVFDKMPHRNMHSWNVLISAYTQHSCYEDAISLLRLLMKLGFVPDHFTLPSIFKACSASNRCLLGRQLHSFTVKSGFQMQIFVGSAIIDMYAKCGYVEDSVQLFEIMSERDSAVFNSLITGFARSGLTEECLRIFRKLQIVSLKIDWRAVPSVLHACAGKGDLRKGKEIHGRAIRGMVFSFDITVLNAIIHMYSQCGRLNDSERVFDGINNRDLVTWSTMISCYASHGKGKVALDTLHDMISQGYKPNSIVMTSVLSACSHSGLVAEGKLLFDIMSKVYGVEPSMEHYACMVDLLGRNGNIGGAVQLIKKMQMEPEASVWGALLSACVVYKNVDIGELAAFRLFELEGRNPSNYVALCTIYQSVGCFEGVSKMMSKLRELRVPKAPGCSWMVLKGKLHTI